MHSIAWWPTLIVLAVATFTDLRSRRIPNWLVFPFLLAGIAVSGWISWLAWPRAEPCRHRARGRIVRHSLLDGRHGHGRRETLCRHRSLDRALAVAGSPWSSRAWLAESWRCAGRYPEGF